MYTFFTTGSSFDVESFSATFSSTFIPFSPEIEVCNTSDDTDDSEEDKDAVDTEEEDAGNNDAAAEEEEEEG